MKELGKQKDRIKEEAKVFEDEKVTLIREKEICDSKIVRGCYDEDAIRKALKEAKKQFETTSGTKDKEKEYLRKEKALKESKPYIEKRKAIMERLDYVTAQIKKIRKPLGAIIEEQKKLYDEISEDKKNHEEKIDNIENVNKQMDRVNEKRNKISEEIDKLKKTKLELQDKYYSQMIDYTKYQYLVSDVKWMTETQNKIREREEYKQKKEQERKERLERI